MEIKGVMEDGCLLFMTILENMESLINLHIPIDSSMEIVNLMEEIIG